MRQSPDRLLIKRQELSPRQRRVLNYAKGVMLARRVKPRDQRSVISPRRDLLWAATGAFIPLVLQYSVFRAPPGSGLFMLYLALLIAALGVQASMLPRAWRSLRLDLKDSPRVGFWEPAVGVVVVVLLIVTAASLVAELKKLG